jgi:hypothetical protein
MIENWDFNNFTETIGTCIEGIKKLRNIEKNQLKVKLDLIEKGVDMITTELDNIIDENVRNNVILAERILKYTEGIYRHLEEVREVLNA